MPQVLILMGSQSDAATMRHTCEMLDQLGISHHSRITSAHRTPDRLAHVAETAEKDGFKVIIAGAGGSAHLPGMTASKTILPVFAVAVQSVSSPINDVAAILSNTQMPAGVPLPYAGLGKAGAQNAALSAARVLALSDEGLRARLQNFVERQTAGVPGYPDYAKSSG